MHYVKQHPCKKNLDLPDAYSVIFVDKPQRPGNLDVLESVWIARLSASINITKTILPKFV